MFPLNLVFRANMKTKNKDRDLWYRQLQAPYKQFFSQREKRVRCRGVSKNQFSVFMQEICFNLKRIRVLAPPKFLFFLGNRVLK